MAFVSRFGIGFDLKNLPGCVLDLDASKGVGASSMISAPTDISGCKLWLRGDLGITQAGGTVSAWADQSGQGNDFVQATGGSQPAFTASALNGKPGVTGAVGKSMTCATEPVAQNAARTIFVVTNEAGTVPNNPFYSCRTAAGYALAYGTGVSPYVETNQTTTNTVLTGTVASGFTVFEATFDGNQTHLISLKLAGVTQTVTNGAGTGVGAEGATAGQTLWQYGTANTICEMIVFDTALSSTDATKVRQYLARRYGLGVAVSSWSDQSITGADVVQATATRQPVLLASAINSKPGLTFNNAPGSEARLDNTVTNLTAAGAARTAFFVLRGNSATKYNNIISFRRSAPGNVFELSSDAAGPYVATDGATYSDSLATPPSPAISGNNWIAEFSMPSNGGSPGTGMIVKLNGTAKTLTTTSTGGETGGTTGFSIGDRLDGGAGFANDYTLCKVGVYNRVLTAFEANIVRKKQSQTYAIAIT